MVRSSHILLLAGAFALGVAGAAATAGWRGGQASSTLGSTPEKNGPSPQTPVVTKAYALEIESCVGDSELRNCSKHSVAINVQDKWSVPETGTIVVVPDSHFVQTTEHSSKEYFTEGDENGIAFTVITRFPPFHDIGSYSVKETSDNGCEARYSFEGNNLTNPDASYVAEIVNVVCRRVK
ncbi:hypothetical protein OIU34_24810 [Pararhizobium sp. BT-229]|uniref:hypothetical protein n=1 Tax=Pararhizobium sp. BT-229 TaxID=2986923 RepID=UPI0021F6C34F|nr:hypothetical protein [Pararhizobium sp. BT-229]MCV9965107.1 hypothetical protein [Pararhizobium sp. BT-229]